MSEIHLPLRLLADLPVSSPACLARDPSPRRLAGIRVQQAGRLLSSWDGSLACPSPSPQPSCLVCRSHDRWLVQFWSSSRSTKQSSLAHKAVSTRLKSHFFSKVGVSKKVSRRSESTVSGSPAISFRRKTASSHPWLLVSWTPGAAISLNAIPTDSGTAPCDLQDPEAPTLGRTQYFGE